MINQFVTIYRALSGPALDRGGRLFTGVTDGQLREEGIFFSNQSIQQSGEMSMFSSILAPDMRMVHGLPVFLTQAEAQRWAEDALYQEGSQPAIAVAILPLETLIGETPTIRIIRNTAVESQDFPVTEKMLRKHLSESELVRGECFLQGDLEILRISESFLRPVEMIQGKVCIERGWQNRGSLMEGRRETIEG